MHKFARPANVAKRHCGIPAMRQPNPTLLATYVLGLLLTACGGRVNIAPTMDGGGAGGDLVTSPPATGGTGGGGGTPTYPDAPTLIEARCPQLVDESRYCVTLNQYNIVAVSPDSGEVCELGNVHTGTTGFESIAVVGTEVYSCSGQLWRAPLTGGEREDTDVDCMHVVAVETKLLLTRQYGEPRLAVYASFEDIVAGKLEQEITLEGLDAGVRAFGAGKLWNWAEEAGKNSPALAFEFPSGEWADDVVIWAAFEEHQPARGFDVTDDERLVAVTHDRELATIDASSGALLSVVAPDHFIDQGLQCWSK